MTDDPNDVDQQDPPKSHKLCWFVVVAFLLLAIGGMWVIDYFFSPEAMAAHPVHDAIDD